MQQVLINLIQLLKKDFITLKAEVDKLDINTLVNVPFNSLKKSKLFRCWCKVKTVPVDLQKIK